MPDLPSLGQTFDQLLRDFAPTVEGARSRPRRRAGGDGELPDVSRAASRGERRLEELAGIWARAVGEEIAGISTPIRYRGGVLTIEIDSAPLAAELGTFARDHLRTALAAEGLPELCDLKFKVRT